MNEKGQHEYIFKKEKHEFLEVFEFYLYIHYIHRFPILGSRFCDYDRQSQQIIKMALKFHISDIEIIFQIVYSEVAGPLVSAAIECHCVWGDKH